MQDLNLSTSREALCCILKTLVTYLAEIRLPYTDNLSKDLHTPSPCVLSAAMKKLHIRQLTSEFISNRTNPSARHMRPKDRSLYIQPYMTHSEAGRRRLHPPRRCTGTALRTVMPCRLGRHGEIGSSPALPRKLEWLLVRNVGNLDMRDDVKEAGVVYQGRRDGAFTFQGIYIILYRYCTLPTLPYPSFLKPTSTFFYLKLTR